MIVLDSPINFCKKALFWMYNIHARKFNKHLEVHAFNPVPNKPAFLPVCSTSLLKTLREKEKLLVTSNFSFSHSVFYPLGELSTIFIKFKIVVCELFQFGLDHNFVLL